MQQLNTICKQPTESISKYCSRAHDLRNQLGAAGAQVTEQQLVMYLLGGLPKQYETVVDVLTTGTNAPTLATVQTALLLREGRLGASGHA